MRRYWLLLCVVGCTSSWQAAAESPQQADEALMLQVSGAGARATAVASHSDSQAAQAMRVVTEVLKAATGAQKAAKDAQEAAEAAGKAAEVAAEWASSQSSAGQEAPNRAPELVEMASPPAATAQAAPVAASPVADAAATATATAKKAMDDATDQKQALQQADQMVARALEQAAQYSLAAQHSQDTAAVASPISSPLSVISVAKDAIAPAAPTQAADVVAQAATPLAGAATAPSNLLGTEAQQWVPQVVTAPPGPAAAQAASLPGTGSQAQSLADAAKAWSVVNGIVSAAVEKNLEEATRAFGEGAASSAPPVEAADAATAAYDRQLQAPKGMSVASVSSGQMPVGTVVQNGPIAAGAPSEQAAAAQASPSTISLLGMPPAAQQAPKGSAGSAAKPGPPPGYLPFYTDYGPGGPTGTASAPPDVKAARSLRVETTTLVLR